MDAATHLPLKGARFKVYNDFYDEEGETASNGEILLTGLDPGDYWVKEIKAPNGYHLNSTPVKVTVVADQTKTITFYNTSEQDYETGTDDYNFLIFGGVLLLIGAALIIISRRRVKA